MPFSVKQHWWGVRGTCLLAPLLRIGAPARAAKAAAWATPFTAGQFGSVLACRAVGSGFGEH